MSAPRFVLVGEDHAGHVHRWNVDATDLVELVRLVVANV